MNQYYLSINSTSLAHYIGKALILPSRFYDNRPSDVQNIQSDYLILSKNKFLNNSNCSIELILNDEELKNLTETKEKNIFLYSRPIPISRIKKIYFIDETQKLKTIDAINDGAAFVPDKLLEIVKEENDKIEFTVNNDEGYKYPDELNAKITKYNQVLGGIAFARYTIEGKYSENYFSILSHFNHFIKQQYEDTNIQIVPKYNGAFTSEGSYWNQLSPFLYKPISEEDVENYAKKEKISIQKINGVFQYDSLEDEQIKKSVTYKIAILSLYGEDSSKRKSINDLISHYESEKIPKEKIEGISLIFGINNGYSCFRNQYKNKIVKFQMDSLLDYYTIESVFQYVINDKKENNKFEYLEDIAPRKELEINKYFETITILDATVVTDKKTILSKLSVSEEMKYLFNTIIEELNNWIDKIINDLKKDLEIYVQKYKNERIKVEEQNHQISSLSSQLLDKKERIQYKDNKLQEERDQIERLNQELGSKKDEIKELKDIINKNSDKIASTHYNNFDEEKEKRLIEQLLILYSKNKDELQKVAKEKGIDFQEKSTKYELMELILNDKESRLFE